MIDVVVFFFKQKTAYEMRMSDWSSDVCSSDLKRLRCLDRREPAPRFRRCIMRRDPVARRIGHQREAAIIFGTLARVDAAAGKQVEQQVDLSMREVERDAAQRLEPRGRIADRDDVADPALGVPPRVDRETIGRSEEHTSELQSLMRISYAVFCLK